MKNLIVLISAMTLSVSLSAQKSGKISYKVTEKLEIKSSDGNPPGIDLSELLGESLSNYNDLYFDENISVYKNGETDMEDKELATEDGSFSITFLSDDTEDVMYLDLASRRKTHQKGFMGKSFIVEEELPEYKWKLTGEKVMYLGYECHKATTEDGEESIVAWFSPQIPVSVGPSDYHQLPGAILMLSINDGKTEIMATDVNLKPVNKDILTKPTKGKKMSEKEFEKTQEDYIKEMKQQFEGRGQTITIVG